MIVAVDPIPLSEEDRAILDLEGPLVAGHTCKVMVLGAPPPSLEALRERVARGLAEEPLLCCLLGSAGGEPAWVEGPVAVEDRVVAVAGPPLDEAGLRELVAKLFSQRLDRSQPLWRIDVAALADGRAALIWRIHHALADGSTAMRMAASILWDPLPGATPAPRPAPASPAARAPAEHQDHRRRREHLAAFIARELGEGLSHSPFDVEIGVHRAIGFGEVALHDLHDAAKSLAGATVNDAVLAAVGGGIHRWIGSRPLLPEKPPAHLPKHLRIRVPVSLHQEGDAAGNRDSFFTLPVDVHEQDPVRRLQGIARRETVRKEGHDAELLERLERRLAERAPRLEHALEAIEASPRSFALCVSNVRGPAHEPSVCGAPVEELYSIAEIGLRHGLRIAAVSLGDRLCLGICADPILAPNPADLAVGIEQEAAAIIAAAG
jgi:WS/DGAT/MGAT family acyltransferase